MAVGGLATVLLALCACTGLTRGSPLVGHVDGGSPRTLELRMPNAAPAREDDYICTGFKLENEDQYITGYEALAEGSVAHHMLVFGCKEPYSTNSLWRCGPECKDDDSQIVYAWARNAKPTIMPQDVGYHIGGDSDIKYLVVQIHYKKAAKAGEVDTSGVKLTLSKEKQPYLAGVSILLSYDGVIPGEQEKVVIDVSCKYDGVSDLHPFGFRTHAHDLSKVVTGYKYDPNNHTYALIGKGNPQWPQAFYPTTEGVIIRPGDYLLARCIYQSTGRQRKTFMGSTHNDEMCNFYFMFYTESGGQQGFECWDDNYPSLSQNLPAGSGVPPPRNKALEDEGDAGHMHEGVEVVKDWPTDDSVKLGQIGGLAVDSKDNVLAFHRGKRTWDSDSFDMLDNFNDDLGYIKEKTLVTFSPDGKVIKQWGDNMFYMPHGLHIDSKDNIWLTDVGLHQVMRFKPGETRPDLVLGTKLEPGNDDDHFCKPTDVAVLESGEFFVSDGYCNARILKYSKDGRLLKKWGTQSANLAPGEKFPPPGTFDIPHSITALEDRQEVCVADRENGRIQCFSYDGEFLRQIHPWQFQDRLFAVSYSPANGLLYAVNGPSLYNKKASVQGFTLDPAAGDADGGLVEAWTPKTVPFREPHDLTVSPTGECIYVGEIGKIGKLWKFHVDRDMLPNHPEPQSVKKAKVARHPASVDNTLDAEKEEEIEEKEETADFNASLVIGALLIIPIVIIIGITVFLRLRKSACGGTEGYVKVVTLPEDEDDEIDIALIRKANEHMES